MRNCRKRSSGSEGENRDFVRADSEIPADQLDGAIQSDVIAFAAVSRKLRGPFLQFIDKFAGHVPR